MDGNREGKKNRERGSRRKEKKRNGERRRRKEKQVVVAWVVNGKENNGSENDWGRESRREGEREFCKKIRDLRV